MVIIFLTLWMVTPTNKIFRTKPYKIPFIEVVQKKAHTHRQRNEGRKQAKKRRTNKQTKESKANVAGGTSASKDARTLATHSHTHTHSRLCA